MRGLTNPTASDMLNLTYLTDAMDTYDITDFRGLEYAQNLTELSVSTFTSTGNNSDISPLSNLTNLTRLSLFGYRIGDSMNVGEGVSEFSVAFDWLGTGEPAEQLYEILNPNTTVFFFKPVGYIH